MEGKKLYVVGGGGVGKSGEEGMGKLGSISWRHGVYTHSYTISPTPLPV